MKLHKLHVQQVRPRTISERMTIAGVLPAVASDLERPPDSAARQHHRTGSEQTEAATLAVVAKRPDDSVTVLQQFNNGALHVHIDTTVDPVILQGPDHLETGPITDMSQSRVLVAAEVTLQDAPVFRAIEHSSPGLEFARPSGGLLCV